MMPAGGEPAALAMRGRAWRLCSRSRESLRVGLRHKQAQRLARCVRASVNAASWHASTPILETRAARVAAHTGRIVSAKSCGPLTCVQNLTLCQKVRAVLQRGPARNHAQGSMRATDYFSKAPSTGRQARLMEDPFLGVRTPQTCLRVMQQNSGAAGPMLRVVGVHTLQKSLRVPKRPLMQSGDAATVRAWLQPFIPPSTARAAPASADNGRTGPDSAPGTRKRHDYGDADAEAELAWASERAERSVEWAHDQAGATAVSPPAVEQPAADVTVLRERGAVLLLYSLAKLSQVKRGWDALAQHAEVQRLLAVLLDHIATMTLKLDAQVCVIADAILQRQTLLVHDAHASRQHLRLPAARPRTKRSSTLASPKLDGTAHYSCRQPRRWRTCNLTTQVAECRALPTRPTRAPRCSCGMAASSQASRLRWSAPTRC